MKEKKQRRLAAALKKKQKRKNGIKSTIAQSHSSSEPQPAISEDVFGNDDVFGGADSDDDFGGDDMMFPVDDVMGTEQQQDQWDDGEKNKQQPEFTPVQIEDGTSKQTQARLHIASLHQLIGCFFFFLYLRFGSSF